MVKHSNKSNRHSAERPSTIKTKYWPCPPAQDLARIPCFRQSDQVQVSVHVHLYASRSFITAVFWCVNNSFTRLHGYGIQNRTMNNTSCLLSLFVGRFTRKVLNRFASDSVGAGRCVGQGRANYIKVHGKFKKQVQELLFHPHIFPRFWRNIVALHAY